MRSGNGKARYAGGFTLIEVMVVVAVIAILASVAYPSYVDYMVRAKLVEGTSALADYRVKMEQYFQDNLRYTDVVGGTNCGAALPTSSIVKHFTITCSATANTFTATAASNTQVAPGAGDYTYTVNEKNQKVTTKFRGATVVGSTCWSMRKGDSC